MLQIRARTGRPSWAHTRKAKVAAKPELPQISTAYKQQPEGERIIPRNKYVEIQEERPVTPKKAKWAEFRTCKYTTEAIVSDGIDRANWGKFAQSQPARSTIPRSRRRRPMPASKQSRRSATAKEKEESHEAGGEANSKVKTSHLTNRESLDAFGQVPF